MYVIYRDYSNNLLGINLQYNIIYHHFNFSYFTVHLNSIIKIYTIMNTWLGIYNTYIIGTYNNNK